MVGIKVAKHHLVSSVLQKDVKVGGIVFSGIAIFLNLSIFKDHAIAESFLIPGLRKLLLRNASTSSFFARGLQNSLVSRIHTLQCS